MSQDWWRHAVIYQVYVRSFADSDGDGVGDLPGIRSRLPYLRDLGVDAVWITPFYASPMADGGYDVADYRAVDPQFGGLDDVRALVGDAHSLGIRVIVDIVPNHSSDQHVWFQEALAGRGRERYIFREGVGDQPPNDWESVFGGPAWTRVADGSWYLHLFAPEQPDLNWELPEVRAEFRDVLRFWLDLGVDGFRVDVAHGMVKAPGLPDIGHADQLKLLAPSRCRSSTRTACTRSTANGAPSSTRTPVSACWWPRRGRPPPSGRRCTCVPTRCTRRSTSTT